MRYSIEPIKRRYLKSYGFLSYAINLNNKHGQKLVDSTKKSSTDAFKIASKKQFKKQLKQFKKQSGFKRVINWNKFLSRPALLAQNINLN